MRVEKGMIEEEDLKREDTQFRHGQTVQTDRQRSNLMIDHLPLFSSATRVLLSLIVIVDLFSLFQVMSR